MMTLPFNIPVAILAGGLAMRLRPITGKIPKSLVPVAGKPFLAHQLELLRSREIRRAVLCVGYLGEMIQCEFGGGEKYGVKLDYSFDGEKLLGAGGGSFLMFYSEDKAKLRQVMQQTGLKEVRFRFDFEGTKLVIS
jgi:NDP-sugar pyrophosphorylase family protein